MSGVSSDFRDVREAADAGNERAIMALDAYRYRVAKYIGSYTAAMNGVDAITFTAGVGENDTQMREEICEYLGVSRDTVLAWIDKREMPATKIGRLWKFKISEVDAWMKSGVAAEK